MGTEGCESTEQMRDRKEMSEEAVTLRLYLLYGLLVVGSRMLSRECTW